jgi:hypothetical protein
MINLKEKNQLFTLLKKHDVPIEYADCIDGEREPYYKDGSSGFICDTIILVRHEDKIFWFKIYIHPHLNDYQYYGVKMRPGKDTLSNQLDRIAWKGIVAHFEDWCISVAYEFNNMDLWDAFKSKRTSPSLPIRVDENLNPKETFSPKEVDNLTLAFESWRSAVISEFELTRSQIEALNGRIETLIELSKSKPKRDWTGVLISFLITMAYDFSLDEEELNKFATLLYKAFNGIIKLLSN